MSLFFEDIAFLAIGLVGLTMSFFTKEIGCNIIKAVEKDGEETRKKLDTLSDKLDTLVTILDKRLPKPQ